VPLRSEIICVLRRRPSTAAAITGNPAQVPDRCYQWPGCAKERKIFIAKYRPSVATGEVIYALGLPKQFE